MEFAIELVNGYGHDERITRLVNATRTIVVPIVNPDGFNLSREWPVDIGTAVAAVDLPAQVNGLLPISDPLYLGALLADAGISPVPGTGFSYKRRNCRVRDGSDPALGECEALANRRLGVDPNRNYGGSWGGAGASLDVEDDTYRGAAPFSEPEVQNVRELVSSHQVTTLVTNHTYGNLVLRPPGLAAMGGPPDEALYRALGDAMAAKNGYTSQHSFELYDTSGATEDWSYDATGGLGFTFEIGPDEFHPPYAETVAEYAGNREAYFVAMESAADSARHAVVEGRARPGTVLRAHKEFDTQTAPVIQDVVGAAGLPRTFRDVLDTTVTVGASGRFSWHLNPSTRPRAAAPEAWTLTCERPAGTVVARGTLVIARGERTTLDLCALRFSLAVERRSLQRALGRGLRGRARCSVGCAARATLTLDNATARRYGLTRRRSGRVVVARGSGGREFHGDKRFSVRFTTAARRQLRSARRLRLRLSASATAGSTDRLTVTRALVLTR
jgi:zinc carboxypeptidase